MDFLKAEIARKKKLIEEKEVLAPNKKYFKRGDLAAKETEEYWKKHKRLKRVIDEDASYSPHSPGGATSSDHSDSERVPDERAALSRKEVIRRLRERSEPIRLFGESDSDAYQRLRKLEIMQPEITKGMDNDFKAAMDRVDAKYLEELIHSSGDTNTEKGNDVKVKDDGTTLEEIMSKYDDLAKGDDKLDAEIVLKFLKLLLKMWGDELNGRKQEEKRSFRGKMASATHQQTVEYIKPLFRKLKQNEMDPYILDCMAIIVKFLLDRHYLNANDTYLEMAIGNAPWPIGVTMVGIHARTGREKISARNVAHVLNDEAQRKYIQAVKRLITQCQKYFPTDPSRCVNYQSDKPAPLLQK